MTSMSRSSRGTTSSSSPEVAASDLELSAMVNPLRKLLRQVSTFVGTVEAIDQYAREVRVTHGFDRHAHDLPYDDLILALGSSTNFFDLPDVESCALPRF